VDCIFSFLYFSHIKTNLTLLNSIKIAKLKFVRNRLKKPRGVKPLILSLSMVLKKNTAESKGIKYGIPALDAVRKFSNEAWLFLAKPLDFLHLCMGGDIRKINTNLILLTGPGKSLESRSEFDSLVIEYHRADPIVL
jgi:hypothetical protein